MMGKHFDALVELAKREIREDETAAGISVRGLLVGLIRRANLFELPIESKKIRAQTEKDRDAYYKYCDDYFNMSHQHGKHLIIPSNFRPMAIEDLDSVVILENINDENRKIKQSYRVVICEQGPPLLKEGSIRLMIGDIAVNDNYVEKKLPMLTSPFYILSLANGERLPGHGEILADDSNHEMPEKILNSRMIDISGLTECTAVDIGQAATSYIEELTYMMDPQNFIVRKENNVSVVNRQKQERKKGRKNGREMLLKTIARPHFFVLSVEDLRDFIRSESKEPNPAHPVGGHWRTLMSERYKNMRGQVIQISQYFTGDGQIKGRNGWNYEVYVKQSPDRVVPYSKAPHASRTIQCKIPTLNQNQ
jgi:hypothetical protein